MSQTTKSSCKTIRVVGENIMKSFCSILDLAREVFFQLIYDDYFTETHFHS